MIATYVMIFGWPTSAMVGARQKIYLLTTTSVLLGLYLSRPPPFRWLAIFLILGLLWIGWPLVIQGRSDAIFLILPIAFGLWTCHQALGAAEKTTQSGWLLIVIAVGLSMIALHGRTISYSQLTLALASSLVVISLLGPKPPAAVPIIAALTMLSSLLGTLILYSDASILAILVLCSCLASPKLAQLLCNMFAIQFRYWMCLLIATVLLTAAIFIAWIDAGAVSVYEGVQRDGAVFQRFVSTGDDGHDWENS